MKKLLGLFIIAVFVVVLPVTNSLASQHKEDICHVTESVVPADANYEVFLGKVINVSKKAIPAHLKHGDSLDYIPMNAKLREALEELLGVDIRPKYNCVFRLPIDG
jgi:hypothetical protein